MAEDPNETARRAFGEGPAVPAPPAPSSAAPQARTDGALAAWGTRAAAYLLDGLFVFGTAFALWALGVYATGADGRRELEAIAYAVAIPLGLLYAPLLMARGGRSNGQTFGKQVMTIRVVRMSGEPVTFWNAFVRQILGQQLPIGLIPVFAFVDYLWPLRDPRNQALHDKLARTLVVTTASPLALSRPTGAERDAVDAGPPQPSPRRVDESPVGDWLPPSAGG